MRPVQAVAVLWRFTCECGAGMCAETEDDIVTAVNLHLATEHPSIAILPSRDDVLAMAECCDERGTLETLG
jgi:hypothetical protein